MEEGTFYGLTMKTPVIYAEIQVLLMNNQTLKLCFAKKGPRRLEAHLKAGMTSSQCLQ